MSHHAGVVPAHCVNCDQALGPGAKFCPECGQKSYVHRLSLHDVGHDAFHYFVHVDRGFLHLLKALVARTGTVAREYVMGKRRKYFPPLNFFLIAAAVYVFAQGIYGHRGTAPAEDWRRTVQRIPDPAIRHSVSRIYERRDFITQVTSKYSNIIYMIATPFLTLIIWLLYWKERYNYTEHLIASLYITGFCALFYAVVIAPLSLVPALAKYRIALLIYFLFETCYRAVFYNKFINKQGTWPVLKNWLVALFIVVFWALFSYGVFYLYIRNGFFGLFH